MRFGFGYFLCHLYKVWVKVVRLPGGLSQSDSGPLIFVNPSEILGIFRSDFNFGFGNFQVSSLVRIILLSIILLLVSFSFEVRFFKVSGDNLSGYSFF